MKLPPIDPIRYAWETMPCTAAMPAMLSPINYGVCRILETAKAHAAIRAKRRRQRKEKEAQESKERACLG